MGINRDNIKNLRLNVNEIYLSIQGEGTNSGLPCVFVRLQGCEIRCSWCDTPYALDIKKKEFDLSIEEIIDKVTGYKISFIEFTGGEPLYQENSISLINYLYESGFTVAVETNGHMSIKDLNKNVIKIMDIKCPGSGMNHFNNPDNLNYITKKDEIKFVISDKIDFEWSRNFILENHLFNLTDNIIFSPVFGKLHPKELADMILFEVDKYPVIGKVRLQLQLHKFIWDPDTRAV